ncbi:uncharacterized protein LOC136043995 [Artemia franciscana]|uniref:uncharacterized protein LOC136043995 n=1 Tax=Artemia franciscana TaxID=6661 RepID=UPI0032DA99A1
MKVFNPGLQVLELPMSAISSRLENKHPVNNTLQQQTWAVSDLAVKNVEQEPIETGLRNDLSRTGSGMFIRVTETEFSGERCYIDGINAKQSKDLQALLLLLQPSRIQIMEADAYVWEVNGMTALQLMSFLKERFEAKIVAHSSNVKQVPSYMHAIGTTSWTLESWKI